MGTPRKEAADHASQAGVELDSGSGGGDVVEDLDVPTKPDTVRVLVQAASGGYDVYIDFENTRITNTGSSTSDVDIERAVNSNTTVTVTITDTSGASNTVDYDILLV
jgi:hypothetical protein